MFAVGYGDSARLGAGDANLESFSELGKLFTAAGSGPVV